MKQNPIKSKQQIGVNNRTGIYSQYNKQNNQ
jgi:hypothetical protein